MDISRFFGGMRGVVLRTSPGWEEHHRGVQAIVIKLGETLVVGRNRSGLNADLHLSSKHCEITATRSGLTLKSIARFDVIVVQTYRGADRSIESNRRMTKNSVVDLVPGDRIHMAVKTNATASPNPSNCFYSFTVCAASSDDLRNRTSTTQQAAQAAASSATSLPGPLAHGSACRPPVRQLTPEQTPEPLSQGTPQMSQEASGEEASGASKARVPPAAAAAAGQTPVSASANKRHSGEITSSMLSSEASPKRSRTSGGGGEPAVAAVAPAVALRRDAVAATPSAPAATPSSTGPARSSPVLSPTEKQWVEVDRKYANGWDGGMAILLDDSSGLGDYVLVQAALGKKRYKVKRKGIKKKMTDPASPAGPTGGAAIEPGSGGTKRRSGRERKQSADAWHLPTEHDKARHRSVERDDVGKRLEVFWADGAVGWYGAKILGFDEQKREFRALYDDGTEEIESITAETYFPDPRECQRRLVHPIAPPELVTLYDPEDPTVPLIGRILGRRPGGKVRVAYIGWSRAADMTIAAETKPKGYQSPSTRAKGEKEVYIIGGADVKRRLQSNYEKLLKVMDSSFFKAQQQRVGSIVLAPGQAEGRIVQAVARQPTGEPKGTFGVWLTLRATTKVVAGTAPTQWWTQVTVPSTQPRPELPPPSTKKKQPSPAAAMASKNKLRIGTPRFDPDVPADSKTQPKHGKAAAVAAAAPRKASSGAAAGASSGATPMGTTVSNAQSEPPPLEAPTLPPLPLVPAYEEDYADLSPSEKQATATLGWSPQLWDACEQPASRQKAWDSPGVLLSADKSLDSVGVLSAAERAAATVLGFTEATWFRGAAPSASSAPSANTTAEFSRADGLANGPQSRTVDEWELQQLAAGVAVRTYSTAQTQALQIEWEEVLEDEAQLLEKLPRFLHLLHHNAELGLIPTRLIFDALVAQLTQAAAFLPSSGSAEASAPSEFSQELMAGGDDADAEKEEEDGRPDETIAQQWRQSREIIHTVLRGLHVQFTASSGDDVAAAAAAAAAAARMSCCWSAVSDVYSSANSQGGPRQRQPCPADFEAFDGNLGRVVTALHSRSAAAQSGVGVQEVDDGAILYVDYVVAVLSSHHHVAGSMLHQLMHDTDPHRCGQHCNQVLNRCAGIVDAAAETSSALAGATDHFCSLALSSAQKLIGLLTSRAAGLLTAKAAVEALKQMYHIQLRTHVSREMFLETLGYCEPTLRTLFIDSLLLPEKGGGRGSGGSNAAVWERVFSWQHCPPAYTKAVKNTSAVHDGLGRVEASAVVAAATADTSARKLRMLMVLYSAVQSALYGTAASTRGEEPIPSPPPSFRWELQRQQAWLSSMLAASAQGWDVA